VLDDPLGEFVAGIVRGVFSPSAAQAVTRAQPELM
jgi:hypothetical protein